MAANRNGGMLRLIASRHDDDDDDKMIDIDIDVAVQVQHTGHQQQCRDLMFTLPLNSSMASR